MNKKFETKYNEPFCETKELPFSPLLPIDHIGLLKWKLYCRERCLVDRDFRGAIDQMCERDVVFFVNTFVWFHEVRETEEEIGVFPVDLDPDQKDILAILQKYVGKIDGVVDKTRGIGLSFLVAAFCIWAWRYKKNRAEMGLVSKDDMSLDMKNRPTTLMGKLDIIFEYLPQWMRYDEDGELVLHRTHVNHRFENKQSHNVIQGYTSTDEKLRSARLNFLFVDEGAFLDIDVQRFLAAGYGTCPSIWWVSTHNGSGTLFHRLTENEIADLIRLSTYWWNNRRCRRGLYKSDKGRIEFLDPDYDYTQYTEYSHEYPGFLRSPWVDRVFRRAEIDAQVVFEELYGVAAIDSHQLIPPVIISAAKNYCQPAIARGHVGLDGEFIEDDLNGDVFFWRDPTVPFTGNYVLGADTALGVIDAAYAALCVVDTVSGEQVASAQFEKCPPHNFALHAVNLAKLISGVRGAAYCPIAYESTGINVSFANELARLDWYAVCRENNKAGFPNNDKGLAWLLELGRAIQAREIVLRDKRILTDLECFEIESSKYDLLFTGKLGHGDITIATAIAWWAARGRRQAHLKAKRNLIQLKQGIESEPIYFERKKIQSTRPYSGRFLT